MKTTIEKEAIKSTILATILNTFIKTKKIKTPLTIDLDNSLFDKILQSYSLDVLDSDFIYLLKNGEVPNSYFIKSVNFDLNGNESYQVDWIKAYLPKNNNKTVKLLIAQLLAKANMDKGLKNQLYQYGLLDVFENIDSLNKKELMPLNKTTQFNKQFTNEEFQDLLFITQCETVYNPELELNEDFTSHNQRFWNRFTKLYKEVFVKCFGESDIFNDSFFFNEEIKQRKQDLGFELLENSLGNKYPTYPDKFSPYLQVVNLSNFDNQRKQDLEYIQYRKAEYQLYLELCNKYQIEPQRLKAY